jgi:hypothetical protein
MIAARAAIDHAPAEASTWGSVITAGLYLGVIAPSFIKFLVMRHACYVL